MPPANPNCSRCQGNGDIEHVLKMADGTLVGFEYSPCPCTFRSQWVDEEDWSDENRRNG